jgi:vacuolar-type H+-ATPase catalytic subunit A/Vma1
VVLSKREKYIAIGVGAAVLLLGIDVFAISPYRDQLNAIKQQNADTGKAIDANIALLRKQKDLKPVWQDILNSGLESDFSNAQSQAQQALQNWAAQSGVALDALSSDREPTQTGVFQAIDFTLEFHVGGQNAMREIARMLWSLESAQIPVRVNDMKVASVKEGTDQLDVKLLVSTLYMPQGTGDAGSVAAPGSGVSMLEVSP